MKGNKFIKRFVSLMIGITILIVLCTGCKNKTSDENQQPTKAYTAGTITDKVYKNESLNIKFTPPDDMKVSSSEELAKREEERNRVFSYVDTIIYSDEKNEYSCFYPDTSAMVMIFSYTLKDKKIAEDEILKKETDNYKTDETTYSTYKIGDTEFLRASDLNFHNPKCTIFVKKVNDHYVSIYVTAKDNEKINKLLSDFSKL